MSNQDIITTIQDLLKLNGSALPATVALTPKDSRLIAAAPELLRCLRGAIIAIGKTPDRQAIYLRITHEELEAINAAIAKAEGK